MNRLFSIATFGVILAGAVLFPTAKASEWDRKTVVTLGEPMDVQGTVLLPGTYVMKLADSDSDRHIVTVWNADETRIFATVLTTAAYRVKTTDDTKFTFYENTPGSPAVLRTWYFAGSEDGEQFNPPPDPRHHN
jgi:hypothetical protein